MEQFLLNNWLSILSIIIGVLVAYVFYRLQKKDSISATSERKKHATNELLDVVESYIIYKQRLSETVIENLIHASERDHAVVLRPTCTPISLLQDVALRLQRSRHLDIPQKSEYSENIEQLIIHIRQSQQNITSSLNDNDFVQLLDKLKLMLKNEKKDEGLALIDEIADFTKDKLNSKIKIDDLVQPELITLTTTLIGVLATLGTSLIGSNIYNNITISISSPDFQQLLPIIGVLIFGVIVTAAVATVIRIKRRNKPSTKDSDS